MYNAKIVKYPDGCQVRIYNSMVGMDCSPLPSRTDKWYDALEWHDDIGESGEWLHVQVQSDWWVNPFTEEWEAPPKMIHEVDRERSIAVSMSRTVNKVYDLSRSNVWDWFVTLTFNPELVDSFDYDCCVKRLSQWLNNIRKICPDLRYLMVPEKHKSGRFHFHGLFACCEGLKFVDSGFKDNGKVIYNVGNYKAGFSTATRVESNERVVKYVTKYITKELCSVVFNRKRYWTSRNLNTAETVELVLDPEQLAELRNEVRSHVKYSKLVETAEISTEYIETDVLPGDCIGYIAL